MNLLGKNKIIIGPEVARRVLKQCEQEKIAISEKLMQVLTAVQSDGRFRAMPLVSLTEKEIDIIKKEIKKFKPSSYKKPGEDLSLGSFRKYIKGNFVYYKDKETVDPEDTNISLSGFLPYSVEIREYVAEHCLQKDGCVQFDSKQQFEKRLQDIFGGVLPESLQKQLPQVRQDADTIIMSSAYRFIPTPSSDKKLCTIQRDIEATCLSKQCTNIVEMTYDFQTMKEGHACLRRITPNRGSWDLLLDHESDVVEEVPQEILEAFSQYDRFLAKIKKEHPELRALLLARRDVQDEVIRQDIFQRIQANEVWKTMIDGYDQFDSIDSLANNISTTIGDTFSFVYDQERLGKNEQGEIDRVSSAKDKFYILPLHDILSICSGPIWTIPVEEQIKKIDPYCKMLVTILDCTHFLLRIYNIDDQNTYYECEIGLKEIGKLMIAIRRYFGSGISLLEINSND